MKSLCLLGVLCGLSVFAAALNREAFTFTKYDLQVQLDPAQGRLGARGTITLRNDSAQPQKIAVLQLSSSLAWHSIKVDGKVVQFVSQPFTSDIDHTGLLTEAIVTLPAEIKPKDSVEIEIAYEGTIPLDTTRLTQVGVPEVLAKHTSWDQISPAFTAVRGVGYVAWYPIATESADFSEGNSMFQVVNRWKAREQDASMKLALSTQAGADDARLLVLCNGAGMIGDTRAVSPNSHSANCEYGRLDLTAPAFTSATLHAKEIKNASVPLNVYFLEGHEEGAALYSTNIDPIVRFVSDWFGTPKALMTITDLADARAAPFETGNILFAPMQQGDPKLAAINVTHMLVHSSLQSPRPWIQEGLAHFAEAVYREKQDGREAALVLLGIHRGAMLDPENEIATSPRKLAGEPLATTFDEVYYRSKAAYVWWMLRDMVGEDTLKRAIRNYRAADDKDPKYVERLISAAANRDLGWFFDDWVYHDRGLPDFHVQAAHPWKNQNGTQVVTITIENLGSAGAEVPFTVRFDGGEITRRLEVQPKAVATTRVEMPGDPLEVLINDGSVPESDMENNTFKITGQ